MQVGQFVYQDVLQALHRLLRQFQVEPDSAGFDAAGAPFGFHPLDAPGSRFNPQLRLPFLQHLRHQAFQLSTVEVVQHLLAAFGCGVGAHE
ncbi:hypothetical protein D3C85_1704870 [compost metagenome]